MNNNLNGLKNSCQIKFLLLTLIIVMGSSYSVFAANAPFQDITQSLNNSGTLKNLVFSINDPARGVVTGQSGARDIRRWSKQSGVIYWVYDERAADLSIHTYAGFSVYDPRGGTWKTVDSRAFTPDDVENAPFFSSGGMVVWYQVFSVMRFAFYDPDQQNWVSTTVARPNNYILDGTGTAAMRTNNGVSAMVYDPIRKMFKLGFSPNLSGSVAYTTANGTVSYQVNGVSSSLGYNSFSGNWQPGTTPTRAYFVPNKTSGSFPLTISFWDLSLGATNWSWNFGNGGSSNVASPTYTYNSSQGSPFTATLTASGPGGSDSYSRTITAPSVPTIGYLDGVNQITRRASGWSLDPDTPGVSILVHFYIDGPAGTGQYAGQAIANIPRPDVNTATGHPGDHGFSFPIPPQYFNNAPHRIYAYGIDTSGNGNQNSQLSSYVEFTFGPLAPKTKYDYNNDGRADQSVFRNGAWFNNFSPGNTLNSVNFGTTGDVPVPADYDGDRITDYAVTRNDSNVKNWYILQSGTGQSLSVVFGAASDKPVPADYDGDGKEDIAVFRPSNGTWYILGSQSGPIYIIFGDAADIPAPGDYDGDGKADAAVFRPSNGTWYIQASQAGFSSLQFGQMDDKPVVADYDGDGKTDIAVFRPSNGTWYLQRSTQGFTAFQFGNADDRLVPADYDGDGKADFAVVHSDNGNGVWYVQQSSNNQPNVLLFGYSTDIPAVGIPVQ